MKVYLYQKYLVFFFFVVVLEWQSDIDSTFLLVSTLSSTYICRASIFDNFNLIMLLSRGHLMYFGKADEMVSYFSRLGYPCPALTNPCDYYGKNIYRGRGTSFVVEV